MDYYSVISRFDPQRHEFYRYEFRWPARLHHTIRVLLVAHGRPELGRVLEAVTTELPYHITIDVTTARHASPRLPRAQHAAQQDARKSLEEARQHPALIDLLPARRKGSRRQQLPAGADAVI